MAAGDPTLVELGAGRLYFATVDTDLPTTATDKLTEVTPADTWRPIGYTEAGSEMSIEMSTQNITAAEQFDPILVAQTARTVGVQFRAMESSIDILGLAVGAGKIAETTTPFKLPPPGQLTPVRLVWDSTDEDAANFATDNRRIIWPNAYPTGTVTISRNKAPNVSTTPITFVCAWDEAEQTPLISIPNAAGQF